ncbi:hypothetical protein [Kitasatospora sp. NPDC093679]|uniref:hypothetical protein n=1 Tax=Kitasatospora sp. NPDC093679 TaxID=3154983 RepID=UPI0034486E2B
MGEFETGATALVKQVLADFGAYEFYTGESMDPDGPAALLNHRADGTTPYLTVIKRGVRAEKM